MKLSWRISQRRLASCVVSGSFIALLINPAAASAETVRPSNFESVIGEITPSTKDITVKVLAGDAYLQVTAEQGTTVQIPGYDGEPYLRITADGNVEQNRRSPAVILNSSRSSMMSSDTGSDMGEPLRSNRFPEGVSSKAAPEFVQVGSGGKVAWHDHRIHWMLSDPPATSSDQVAQDWIVPMTVNGEEVTVTGQLLYRPNVFPWTGILAVLIAAVAAWLARSSQARLLLLLAAGLCAATLSLGALFGTAPTTQSSQPVLLTWLPLGLSLAAAATIVFAIGARHLSRQVRMIILPLLSIAALAGWAAPRLGLFWMPVVPSIFVDFIERGGTAFVIGVIAGASLAILIRPIPSELLGLVHRQH